MRSGTIESGAETCRNDVEGTHGDDCVKEQGEDDCLNKTAMLDLTSRSALKPRETIVALRLARVFGRPRL